MTTLTFSEQLEAWLTSKQPKTIASLESVFKEKSFAIGIMLLMFLPALPIPTGGITHVFEIVTMLLSLELIIGRRSPWLPRSWRQRSLGALAEKKVLPLIIKYVRWFERFSRHRLSSFLERTSTLRLVGVLTLVFTLAAFVSPPFSGLDTLPALGIVIMMLALILEDGAILVIGCLVGAGGIGLIISLSSLLVHFVQRFV